MGEAEEPIVCDPEGWLMQHGDALYAYALSRVRCPEAAADLVQDALVAGLQCAERFEGRSQERTWLIGILRHKTLDYFRRSRRRKSLQELTLDEGQGTLGLYNKRGRWRNGPKRWGDDPAALYEQQAFWAVYDTCLQQLPDTLREAYVLRELEGLSVQEVCKLLEISSTNLSVRLHRARLALRTSLDQKWFQG